jgi:hypothetical protein
VAELDRNYIERMEDVLAVYEQPYCVFRGKPIAHSGACRSLIPTRCRSLIPI